MASAADQRSLPLVACVWPLPRAVTDPLLGKVQWCHWPDRQSSPAAVDGLYCYGHGVVDEQLLQRLPNLRAISNFGVGVDHIDVAAARRRGIAVGHTPGVLDAATADMALTLMLACARRLVIGDQFARSSHYTRHDSCRLLGTEVSGQSVGIVGMGRIGQQVARRCQGFGMRVSYHNRRPLESLPPGLQATYVAWEQLLAESDFIVLCVPLTPQTTGLIGVAELAAMKQTAILINVARGGVVDTAALTEALQRRQILAAGLDVTDPEPLPRDSPLLQCDNLVITPHLGSATVQTRQRMARLSVENLLLGLSGQPLLHAAPA